MKLYCDIPQPSLGLARIRDALIRYAPPSVEIVANEADADLVVIYAIGRREHIERQVDALLKRGAKYAIVQVCLRSTMSPSTHDWGWIWHDAVVVWSYYDLEQAFSDDRGVDDELFMDNFYHAPLGADADVFCPRPVMRNYIVTTSGSSRLSESVRECWLAAKEVGKGTIAHVGPIKADGVFTVNDVSDSFLSSLYSGSQFVSGLRRTEGFELPAVEGLLCGARPIVFDTPDYRWNYRDHAEYIYEGTRQQVVDQLVQLFKAGPRPVTTEERERAVAWFNWATIVNGFYQRLL